MQPLHRSLSCFFPSLLTSHTLVLSSPHPRCPFLLKALSVLFHLLEFLIPAVPHSTPLPHIRPHLCDTSGEWTSGKSTKRSEGRRAPHETRALASGGCLAVWCLERTSVKGLITNNRTVQTAVQSTLILITCLTLVLNYNQTKTMIKASLLRFRLFWTHLKDVHAGLIAHTHRCIHTMDPAAHRGGPIWRGCWCVHFCVCYKVQYISLAVHP